MADPSMAHAGATLTIDLAAIRDNYRQLKEIAGGAACAAVVKADAYGLGASRVAPALEDAGCDTFFVAHIGEAIALRPHLKPTTTLIVLHGPPPGTEPDFVAHDIRPVLSSREQIHGWSRLATRLGRPLDAMLQVDTGMSRLGLPPDDVIQLAEQPEMLDGIRVRGVMSHLACADDPQHPANAEQHRRFVEALRRLPPAPACLSASSGIFLGPDFHFDMVRPGAALYGIAPVPGRANPMSPVVRLQARLIQTRTVPAGAAVGYGYTHRTTSPRRIATVSVGYADGYLRALSGNGCAHVGDVRLPVVGRVSMDTITLDATDVDDRHLQPGAFVDLIGPKTSVDDVARSGGTIGYEILTSIGNRYHRVYAD